MCCSDLQLQNIFIASFASITNHDVNIYLFPQWSSLSHVKGSFDSKGVETHRLRTSLDHFADPPLSQVSCKALEGPLYTVALCSVSGARLDPKWRVHVKRWAHYSQLAAGSRAAAERTRTVPACDRGKVVSVDGACGVETSLITLDVTPPTGASHSPSMRE